jgi:hypothetical protein
MEILSSVFDEARVIDGRTLGGQGKEVMFNSRTHIGKDFEFTDNDPLTAWIEFALVAGKQWIDYMDAGSNVKRRVTICSSTDELSPPSEENLRFKDHEAMALAFKDVLDLPGWPVDDRAVDGLPPQTNAP